MFELPQNAKQVLGEDVVPFVDLLSHWPYEPAVKIAKEYFSGNLSLHFVESCIQSDGKDYAILNTVVPVEPSQSFACRNLSRLVYLREDIFRIDTQNPLYAAETTANTGFESVFDVYSAQKVAHLAAEILNVLQIIHWQYRPTPVGAGKPFPPKGTIVRWMEKDKIYNPEHCLPAPKKKWRVSIDQMIPVTRKQPSRFLPKEKCSVDFDSLNLLMVQQRSQGASDIELGWAVLQAAPGISNGALARLIFNIEPKTPNEYDAARQRGLRLKRKVIKSHA